MRFTIKERRLSLGMTQEELARLSGVSRQTIVMLESDKELNATTKKLAAIANALNTTVGALFLSE